MTREEKITEFAVFCIESVAERLNELPEQTYRKLRALGLMDELIFGCYDSLHTQSKQLIVDDILTAIANRERGGSL